MNKNAALIVAGVIFSIVALIHVVRLITGFEVIFEGKPVPLFASGIALVVSGLLAVWMFAAAKTK
jgi:hypothetical protein